MLLLSNQWTSNDLDLSTFFFPSFFTRNTQWKTSRVLNIGMFCDLEGKSYLFNKSIFYNHEFYCEKSSFNSVEIKKNEVVLKVN